MKLIKKLKKLNQISKIETFTRNKSNIKIEVLKWIKNQLILRKMLVKNLN
jgi:hypothetical protein